jgi:hypothetical protein
MEFRPEKWDQPARIRHHGRFSQGNYFFIFEPILSNLTHNPMKASADGKSKAAEYTPSTANAKVQTDAMGGL